MNNINPNRSTPVQRLQALTGYAHEHKLTGTIGHLSLPLHINAVDLHVADPSLTQWRTSLADNPLDITVFLAGEVTA